MEGTDECVSGETASDKKECEALSRFSYVQNLTETQQAQLADVEMLSKHFDRFLCQLPSAGSRTFSDRCIAMARTHLEDVCTNAKKAICFEGKEVI